MGARRGAAGGKKRDGIKIAEETRERGERRKGGRKGAREGASDCESKRTSCLEPRQIALEGYLLKYFSSCKIVKQLKLGEIRRKRE